MGASLQQHFRVLIIGAGSAGATVAARLARVLDPATIGLLDPAQQHDYQPLWTFVGAGVCSKVSARRSQASVLPKGVTWLREAAAEFLPGENVVVTAAGVRLGYDYLVVAPGIQVDWHRIGGLEGRLGWGGICSNYSYESVDSTWESIQNFEGGNAIFTHPNTPIKCGGAPQKIMYLAADYWRKHPPKKPYQVRLCMAPPKIFGVEHYAQTLLKVVQRYGIEVHYCRDLVSVDAETRQARFLALDGGEELNLDYGMLHVTPPMSAPDFLKRSSLGDAGGWVDVNKNSLQHMRYANIYALGDAANLPTSKTGAGIRKQAPVLVANLLADMAGETARASYDGYTSCPLVTGYGKLVMAEFDYEGRLCESFPIDQSRERLSMYLVTKYLIPRLYWQGMLKGRDW